MDNHDLRRIGDLQSPGPDVAALYAPDAISCLASADPSLSINLQNSQLASAAKGKATVGGSLAAPVGV
ncbi:hypothetical protein NDU88_010895 [Pleurodeles waltl]|uniref:Uncharacterized protein n=1 Tax=Pleurodeles waltl TaxID=8319 RepID=A0AAV7QVN6_PLEWA|nr:hypothetical protein NDU88_010895 [Pleurodeles waltl]